MILSICIPTYNRPNQLPNCLNSIYLAKKNSSLNFEVCISDNGSNYDVTKIVKEYENKLNIKLNKNKTNLGYQPNLLKVISIASGEYVWAIGDDDFLTQDSLQKVEKLLNENRDVDFFYINSYLLDYSYLDKFEKPFDTKNLPQNMEKLSKKKISEKLHFWDLIDHKVSFDFLLGNFLNIFKRKMWSDNVNCLNKDLLKDNRVWSNFDNTCAHIKIYANAFKNSKAYFYEEALTVNSLGVREWAPMYPFIEIIRLPEMLDYYRSRGLSLKKYLLNKNYALRNFSNYFLKIIIRGKKGGLSYVSFYRHVFLNLIYPNVYLSVFYFAIRKLKKILKINKIEQN
tara:strand:- start:11567 stop:12589 length:1023 start_codon:yes stop_codon:yes gene_type:complete